MRSEHHELEPGRPRRPLKDLSIRELVVELGAVEETVARRPAQAADGRETRAITAREKTIIAELRRRAADAVPDEYERSE